MQGDSMLLLGPPTKGGNPKVWLSGLVSAPSLPSASDESPRRTASEAGPGCPTRPRTSSMLERGAPPMLWMRLWARARPSVRDALDTKTRESWRELAPLPVPEPELVFRERERGRKAPLLRASDVALPLREPSRDALGLSCEDEGDRRPTESSRSRASSEPSGDDWPERDARSSLRSSSSRSSEAALSGRRCRRGCSNVCHGLVAERPPAGVGEVGEVGPGAAAGR
jgi:hypothetical protein